MCEKPWQNMCDSGYTFSCKAQRLEASKELSKIIAKWRTAS